MGIQPEEFWKAYKAELMGIASAEAKQAYRSDFEWTPLAIGSAKRAIAKLGLKPQSEYFRLDLIGYESHGIHNWTLRVAFEHENRDHWTDELCKLCHVVADLRVLTSYWDFRTQDLDLYLKGCLNKVESQVRRYPSKWLFVFGPRCRSFEAKYPFVAYEYNGTELCQLPDDGALNPFNWPTGGK